MPAFPTRGMSTTGGGTVPGSVPSNGIHGKSFRYVDTSEPSGENSSAVL